jgi:hypothetical protein
MGHKGMKHRAVGQIEAGSGHSAAHLKRGQYRAGLLHSLAGKFMDVFSITTERRKVLVRTNDERL